MEERTPKGFEHKVLKKVSVPIRVEVAGDWRILRSEELHDLIRLRVVKEGSVMWAGNVTGMEVGVRCMGGSGGET
jgi:hypothetical protein